MQRISHASTDFPEIQTTHLSKKPEDSPVTKSQHERELKEAYLPPHIHVLVLRLPRHDLDLLLPLAILQFSAILYSSCLDTDNNCKYQLDSAEYEPWPTLVQEPTGSQFFDDKSVVNKRDFPDQSNKNNQPENTKKSTHKQLQKHQKSNGN